MHLSPSPSLFLHLHLPSHPSPSPVRGATSRYRSLRPHTPSHRLYITDPTLVDDPRREALREKEREAARGGKGFWYFVMIAVGAKLGYDIASYYDETVAFDLENQDTLIDVWNSVGRQELLKALQNERVSKKFGDGLVEAGAIKQEAPTNLAFFHNYSFFSLEGKRIFVVPLENAAGDKAELEIVMGRKKGSWKLDTTTVKNGDVEEVVTERW
eukprot:TRINITY_DN6488_c0_g1_i1.p1 TRINITY_DN6488_c0_g1~~TRINITY_DN6488_c0_g1_i1.p1  ORF type:complete len:230 (-),score=72.82 TRINITY_DN6488_c0_g1_i1:90-728(-)